MEASGGKQHVDRRNEKMVSATRFCGTTPDIHYDRLSSKAFTILDSIAGVISHSFKKFPITLFLVVNSFFPAGFISNLADVVDISCDSDEPI